MFWLFGQIWIWLLIAFALGAGITALLLTRGNSDEKATGATGATRAPATAPPPEAERTETMAPVGDIAMRPRYEDVPGATGDELTRDFAYREKLRTRLTRVDSGSAEPTYGDSYGEAYGEAYGEHAYAEPARGDLEPADLDLAELDSEPDFTELHRPDLDDEELGPPDLGHREGVLPSTREWHQRNEWPDEVDLADGDDSRAGRGR